MSISRLREAIRNGVADAWAASVLWKDAPSPPPPPDYTGAAKATSAGSVQASIANNLMAHPNIYTPLGSQTWSPSGKTSVPSVGGESGFDIPTYTQNINMTPEGQNLFNKQMYLSTGLLGLGNNALDRTAASLNSPMDMQSVQDIADKSYGLQAARLDPQWQQAQTSYETKLINQGLRPGDEAYDNAMRVFNQGKNDAYNQARLSSISTMPQTYQLGVAERQQPLTELASIRSGAQPQMPQFQPTQYAMGAQGPNMLAATTAQGQYNQGLYNSQLAQQSGMMGGLFDLGGAVLGGGKPWWLG